MGYITEEITVTQKRKIKVAPCLKCGSENIDMNDCGYSSFNVATAKCEKCGNAVQFNCGCDISKKEIAKAWNKQNDKKLLIKDYQRQIKKLQNKITKLQG